MRLQLETTTSPAAKELTRRLRASNTNRFLGFTVEAAEPGRAVLAMRVRELHRQVHGVVHGGIIATLADTAAALGVYMALPRGTPMATVEMKINFLEPLVHGVVIAEGRMLRKGRNFAVAECDVRDHSGQLAAKALMTFAISPAGLPKLKQFSKGRSGGKKRGRKRKGK